MVISNEILKTDKSNYQELKNKSRAFNELAVGTDRMLLGEYLDTELENKNISKELLQYIHENKTGALLKASIRIGAILADAPEDDIEKLSKFAEKIGLAFQIKDDILSEEGNQEIMGKPVGNDRERKKSTYVSYYGLENAKKELDKIINDALEYLDEYGEKAEFLRGLTIYIRDREK